jgi:hypothetical protein
MALPVLMLFLGVAAPLRAQTADVARPSLTAIPAPVAPVLDGRIAGDPAWAAAPVATNFVQTSPDEGRPSSERTEIRIVYTRDTLFVGVTCFDHDPGGIVLSEGRRDSALDKVDSVRILLDTFGDRQNAVVFGTTPAGAEFDGQVINDGGGNSFAGGQQGGALGGFNLNWDAAWDVRTAIGPEGWTAELAIPFRTLRYRGGGAQSWGLNFQRVIQRRNETTYWAPLGRQQDLYRVSEAGRLDGLDLPAQRNLKLTPYLLGAGSRDYHAGTPRDLEANAGVDLKYSVTPSLTLDATVRTDFAQVEVDEQQLQLDRFNLLFPEKRPFFLENAGLFSGGLPGEIDFFFSRRIGVGPRGEVIPILAGARLSGKIGRARIGILDMQTERVSHVAAATNFGVLRFAWELGNRSYVGAFFGSRQATASLTRITSPAGDPEPTGETIAARDNYGRTVAADARLGIGRYGLVSGFVAATQTPGDPARPFAGNLSTQYDSPGWLLDGRASYSGAGFDPQVGFLRRTDYRKAEITILRRLRPDDLFAIKELRPHTSGYVVVKPDGFLESRYWHLDNHVEWRSGLELHSGINFTGEGVRERFEIDPKHRIFVEPGRYNHVETQLALQTPEALPVNGEVGLTAGGFYGGRRLVPSLELNVRARDVFTAQLKWQHNRFHLPGGDFVANLGKLRLSYSFTPRTFVQALLQYNDRLDVWSTNLRLGWLRDANTGLFLVYNENRGIGADDDPDPSMRGTAVRDRRVVLKLSWLVDVLR